MLFTETPKLRALERLMTSSSRTSYRSRRLFYQIKKPPLAHSVAPPFRKRPRSARLFGCKRPHDADLSLPLFCGFASGFVIVHCFEPPPEVCPRGRLAYCGERTSCKVLRCPFLAKLIISGKASRAEVMHETMSRIRSAAFIRRLNSLLWRPYASSASAISTPARISYLKDFTEKHPEDRRGWMWLLDNLLDDYRLKEAAEALKALERIDSTYRTPLYRAHYLWYSGRRDEAREALRALERDFPNEWCALTALGEYAAMDGDYKRAIDYAKKAIAAQNSDKAQPRFTDTYITLAQLCELNGDIEGAIAAHETELEMLREDWGVTSGETRDSVLRHIERLKMKLK